MPVTTGNAASGIQDHRFLHGAIGFGQHQFGTARLIECVYLIAEVLKREPRHFGALSGLAMIKIKRGDLRTALTLYENILLIHPHNRDALKLIPELRKTLQGDPA